MKNSFKRKIGIGLVIIGFICPIIGLGIPFLGLNSTTTTALVTFFMVGGPEIFLVLGGLLAGKEGVLLVTNRIKRFVGLPEGRYPASKSQYNIGVVLLILWFPLVILPGYVPGVFEIQFVQENLLWLSIGVDLMFILAIFGFGGNQMISKLFSIIKWEEWELPQKKE